MKTHSQEQRIFWLSVVGLVLLGGWFRFWELGLAPLWVDEESLWLEAFGVYTGASDGILPLEVTYFFMRAVGSTSNFAVRFPSTLASTLAIAVFAMAGRRLGGNRAGLLLAGLVALSPYFIEWGRMARPYGMLTLGIALVLWAFLALLQDGERRHWVAFALAASVASACHVNTIQLLTGLGVWFAYQNRTRPRRAFGFILLCGLAWLPVAYLALLARPSGLDRTRYVLLGFSWPSWSTIWYLPRDLSLFSRKGIVFPALTLIGMVALWGYALRRPLNLLQGQVLKAFLGIVFFGLALTLICLGTKTYPGWPRYLLPMIGIGYAVAAVGLDRLVEFRRYWAWALIALLVAGALTPREHRDFAGSLRKDSQKFFSMANPPIPPGIDGILLRGGHRAVGGLGRHYSLSYPVMMLKPRHWGLQRSRTRWTLSRGNLRPLLVVTGQKPSIPPGTYLVLADPPKHFCVKELKGDYDPRPTPYRTIAICKLGNSPRHRISQKGSG